MAPAIAPAPSLCIYTLGGFRVDRDDRPIPASDWLRRAAARTLVKLLAVRPEHRFHREEMLEMYWPGADMDSARNRFGKALHAARHALEPGLPPRRPSSYLRFADDIVSLDVTRVWIDVDHFERLAGQALRSGEPSTFEAALAAYSGELLPEDRYEDWAIARQNALAGLYTRTLCAYAAFLDQHEAYQRVGEILHLLVEHDPLQEGAHRHLMLLYASHGNRQLALRQYEICRRNLREEVDAEPESETEQLLRDIMGGHVPQSIRITEPVVEEDGALPMLAWQASSMPLVGRENELETLREQLVAAGAGSGLVTLIRGEAGIGKTRLAQELAREAVCQASLVLWGRCPFAESPVPYGPFVEALEGYLVARPSEERHDFAAQYPLLSLLVPSLRTEQPVELSALTPELIHGGLAGAFASFLAELSVAQPLVLVLDDLHRADAASLRLFQCLGRASADHGWLIAGMYRDEDVKPDSEIRQALTSMACENLYRSMTLDPLSQDETNRLVESILCDREVSPRLLHQLYALCVGNPLFVFELIRGMREEGLIECIDSHWQSSFPDSTQIPRHVRGLVTSRLGYLGEETARVLHLAAVAGTEWSWGELRTAAAIAFGAAFQDEALLHALDKALDAGVLEDRGEMYAFRYPLVPAALLAGLPAHRVSHYHTALAGAIELHRPDNVELLAHHYSRGYDREKAMAYLQRTGQRTQPGEGADA